MSSRSFAEPAATGNGVRLAVRLTPKASRNRIEGLIPDVEGGSLLKVSVTAVPEGGKANAALIGLLAKALRIAKGTITITAGLTDRRKVLFIEGDGAELTRRLTDIAREK